MNNQTNPKPDILPTTENKSDSQYIFIFIGVVLLVFFLLIGASIGLYFLYFKNLDLNKFMEELSEPAETNTLNTRNTVPAKPSVTIRNNVSESTSSNSINVKTTTNTNKSNPTPVTTTTTTVTSKPAKVETYAPGPTYYKYSLGDPFNVTKSYVYDDYVKIMSAYNSYVGVNNMIPYTKNAIKMTCDGSDFFADSCKRNKESLKEEEERKDKYEAQVLSIIPRGK